MDNDTWLRLLSLDLFTIFWNQRLKSDARLDIDLLPHILLYQTHFFIDVNWAQEIQTMT